MSKEPEKKQACNRSGNQKEQLDPSEKAIESDAFKKLINSLKEEKQRSADYLNRLKYLQADFENLKKRQDRQLEELRKFSNERLILELLGIIDELEAAVQESKQIQSVEALLKGVEMTLKKAKKALELENVSPIECIGQVFDPSKHEVIARIESEEEGKIIEEIRKGYTMKGKVIRPSIVKIAVKPNLKSREEDKTNE